MYTEHTHPPGQVLATQTLLVLTAPDPEQALREAATTLAPLLLCGQLTEDQITDPLEEAAFDRGVDGDDTATILYARLSTLFN
ncbi:hypothetical protein [Nocardiopsis valliformis]|uniref:hypothetical protein n=1 Tax=Nocardiopsis valliformis TaxID=239974 RepID=UPI0003487DF8|nr:hypothetical protein [Nocardiopsis valliformis]